MNKIEQWKKRKEANTNELMQLHDEISESQLKCLEVGHEADDGREFVLADYHLGSSRFRIKDAAGNVVCVTEDQFKKILEWGRQFFEEVNDEPVTTVLEEKADQQKKNEKRR